jgi:hypothetical protein
MFFLCALVESLEVAFVVFEQAERHWMVFEDATVDETLLS